MFLHGMSEECRHLTNVASCCRLALRPEADATSGEEDMLIHGERLSCTSEKDPFREETLAVLGAGGFHVSGHSSRLVPTSLRRLVVRAAGTQWHFDPQTGEEPVEIHEAGTSPAPPGHSQSTVYTTNTPRNGESRVTL